jgi:hypothetical protein
MQMDKTADLKVLRLIDYESYQLPFFRSQAVGDEIFVDDLRDNDDDSLDLVPRITTFAQLKETFKLDVDYSLGRDATPPGDLYWAVIGFYLRTGIAAFIPKVLAENEQPVPPPGALVYAHWPGAPSLPEPPNPHYHGNGVAGFTNASGDVGFGYSGGAVVGGDGGVYDIWVSADPPTGTRFYSDAAIRLGWWGGTDHLTPNPIFQAIKKSGGVLPPIDGAKLVVFDALGGIVGEVGLESGQGTGGRISLFADGKEQSFVRLE